MGIKYATREDVKNALDSKSTARNDAQVDRALDAATNTIHGLCHRTFYPELKTVAFDWPDTVQRARSWRLWLDANEVISITTLVSGGVAIPTGDYLLYPNPGPPYNRIEVNLGSASAFSAGDTHQQSLAITGLFGHSNVEAPAGQLTSALNAAVTAVGVTGSAAVGVGSLLRVDDERLLVTGKRQATTGQTLQADLIDKNAGTVVSVVDGTLFAVDEMILIDGERMRVEDIAGNTLVVKRAADGSVLAGHTAGATIYAPRTLLVDRGVLGTTAAAHDNDAPVVVWMPPPIIRQLAIAEALVDLGDQTGGYAQSIRAGESARKSATSIEDIRDRAYTDCGRKARTRAV